MTVADKIALTGLLFLVPTVLAVLGMIWTDPGLGSDGDAIKYARWQRLCAVSAGAACVLGFSGGLLGVWSP